MASVGEERRTEPGLKQGALAKRGGTSQATLSELENNPTVKTREVARLAAVLGGKCLVVSRG
jgi:transcriptional regulator with XRE-family HTH domain